MKSFRQNRVPIEIISGGQTGVDRAALDVAIEMGIPHSGWCPRGRLAEDGPIAPEYQLRETESSEYPVRTERNVRDSDGTLLIFRGLLAGGTSLTHRLARRYGKPLFLANLAQPLSVEEISDWVLRHGIRRLNVAGPRESTNSGIHDEACELLRSLIAALEKRVAQASQE